MKNMSAAQRESTAAVFEGNNFHVEVFKEWLRESLQVQYENLLSSGTVERDIGYAQCIKDLLNIIDKS